MYFGGREGEKRREGGGKREGGGREGGREGRSGGWEEVREGGREGEREGRNEGGRKGGREGGREYTSHTCLPTYTTLSGVRTLPLSYGCPHKKGHLTSWDDLRQPLSSELSLQSDSPSQ